MHQTSFDRSNSGPGRIFKGYQGHLQADACPVYDASFKGGTIVEVGRWTHARRKFHEARAGDPARSHVVLAWIVGLREVEEDAKLARKEHPDWDDVVRHAHRYELRSRRSRPTPDAIHTRLAAEQPKVLPESPIGEAIAYALNHRAALIRPLESGFLEIDDGASGRAMRPVAPGRRDWLSAGSDDGGKTAAALTSLCTTCKAWDIDPFAYLRDVLDRVGTHPNGRIDELLPDRWKPAESTDPGGREGQPRDAVKHGVRLRQIGGGFWPGRAGPRAPLCMHGSRCTTSKPLARRSPSSRASP